ncbi:MAG: thiamine-phosphate kinase [Deltaproteobacteria bacterium]|nr:thiamine-phosphate kinase [Deltaproteobacteria bacterium]
MTETLAEIGEFGLIDRIDELLKKEGIKGSGVILGIGDDAASFIPNDGYELLVTCDCMVEGRHYLADRILPFDLGRRSMVMNISDIGAMGGRPMYALVSLGLKVDTPVTHVEAMYRGFMSELAPFEASIIGGNITRSDLSAFIDITLIGEVEREIMMRRSSARPGDLILVTGYPGEAAAGLRLLTEAGDSKDLQDHPLVRAYNCPSHRAKEGRALALSGFATSMIDISDGLLGDLGHICQGSSVGAELIQEKLPVSDNMRDVIPSIGMDLYDIVMKDSDDYELIVTCLPENADRISSIVEDIGSTSVTEIGRITSVTGGIRLILPDNSQREIIPAGWDHFKR